MKEALLDKIEAYLNGQLDAGTEAAFEREIEQNPDLARAVDNFGVANDALEVLIADNLREEMKSWSGEQKTTNVVSINRNRRSRMRYWAAAASVALVLGFFGLNIFSNGFSNDVLGRDFYENYEVSGLRSARAADNPLATGLSAYAEKDFAAAAEVFRGVPAADDRYEEAQFLLGHTLMEQRDYAAAADQFGRVIEQNDVRYRETAEWNQLLAWLHLDRTDATFQARLQKIVADPAHSKNAEAVQLNERLNSFWYGWAN